MNKSNPKKIATESVADPIHLLRALNEEQQRLTGKQSLAYTHTYGCQQNSADTEKLDGLLIRMGYGFAKTPEQADVVLYNTCAVREGAEDRVFGNVGALKQAKLDNPKMIIGLCGCMVQQQHIADKIKKSYPFVDLVFGAGAMHTLPDMLFRTMFQDGRQFHIDDPTIEIVENLPTYRNGTYKTWIPIMTGCDNFCTYCVVPLVRGRERSREPAVILAEVKELIATGYKEITLLGQNVNSYGKTLDEPISFVELLEQLCEVSGEFQIRFLTSHPKDCTTSLIDCIGKQPKMVKHLHLPIQSGSNRVLEAMNRRYTAEHYLSLVNYAKANYPDMALSSDIIVGFPNETAEDFQETLQLVKRVGFTSLYTYFYSSRENTKAATMDDPVPLVEKKRWFQQLLDLQNPISQSIHRQMVGQTYRILLDDVSRSNEGYLSGRSQSDIIVDCKAPKERLGQFVTVKITQAHHWAVVGEIIE